MKAREASVVCVRVLLCTNKKERRCNKVRSVLCICNTTPIRVRGMGKIWVR